MKFAFWIIRSWHHAFNPGLIFKKKGVAKGTYTYGKIYPFYGGSKAMYLGRGWFKYVNS